MLLVYLKLLQRVFANSQHNLRSALNCKAITKYYDFNLQSGYKPSRMQNGLTTSRGGNQ